MISTNLKMIMKDSRINLKQILKLAIKEELPFVGFNGSKYFDK